MMADAVRAMDQRGARAGLASALAAHEDRLLPCVHCGFCLPACPTYNRLGDENDSPRGRLYLMRAVVEGRLAADNDAFATHIDRCLGCRACEPVCPSGVRYGFLLERTREVIARERGTDWLARVSLRVFGNRVLTRVVSAGARIMRTAGLAGAVARALPRRLSRIRFATAMVAASRPTPFHDRVQAGTGVKGRPGGRRPKAAIFRGCVQQGLFARVNRATAAVLEACGCEVLEVGGEACCGALHAHNGDLDGARRLAGRNVRAFMDAEPDVVVVNAAGCGAMMKEYGELLSDDLELAAPAAELAGRVRDLFEFLAAEGIAPGGPVPLRGTLDLPCHLVHGQGIADAPAAVLAAIPGLELVPLPNAEECCGGAGTYGMTHPELGGRILRDKLDAIRSTGADVVLTPNPGCHLQIGAGLLLDGSRVRVMHPVELLAESYRRAGREV